jgi:two-component system OmpR family response regulator
MPAINGLELCKVIRSDRTWASLPILFLTACREPDVIRQIYISKPFTELDVVTRIFNRLKRNRLLQRAI